MDKSTGAPRGISCPFTPARRAQFLERLGQCGVVAEAARAVGIRTATAYRWRRNDAEFRGGWEAALGTTQSAPRIINPGGKGPRLALVALRHDRFDSERQDIFLAALAETSNVTASAGTAGINKKLAYDLRRRDPGFRSRWLDALAEGYDALEMEMLARARFGTQRPVFHAGERIAEVTHYSDATAMRLLVAHRLARSEAEMARGGEAARLAGDRLDEKLHQMRERLAELKQRGFDSGFGDSGFGDSGFRDTGEQD